MKIILLKGHWIQPTCQKLAFTATIKTMVVRRKKYHKCIYLWKFRIQDFQVAIRLVTHFKIVHNTTKVFQHGLIAVVIDQAKQPLACLSIHMYMYLLHLAGSTWATTICSYKTSHPFWRGLSPSICFQMLGWSIWRSACRRFGLTQHSCRFFVGC